MQQRPHSSLFIYLNCIIILMTTQRWLLVPIPNTLQKSAALCGYRCRCERRSFLSERQDIRSSLTSKQLILQQSNTLLMGTRFKVWLYNKKHNEKKSNRFWNLMLARGTWKNR